MAYDRLILTMGVQINIDISFKEFFYKLLRSRLLRYVVAIICLATIIAIAVHIATGERKPAFSKTDTAEVNFPWYYPSALPGGASIDTGSFSYEVGVVTFVVRLPQNKHIVFNEQVRPPGLDTGLLKGSSTVDTNLGVKAQIKAGDEGYTGSVLTSTTMILGNSRDTIDNKIFSQVFSSFNRY